MNTISVRATSARRRRRGSIVIGAATAALAVVAALVAEGPAQAAVIGGSGPTAGGNTVQVDVAGSSFTSIFGDASSSTAYGLTDDHTLYAWGYGFSGQIGDGSTVQRSVPTQVTTSGALAGKTIVQVAAGTSAIALASDGTIFTWGNVPTGPGGGGSSAPSSTVPVAVPMTGVLAGKTITQVASGSDALYALASDGSVFAWGRNQYGQLGVGNTSTSYSPAQVPLSGVPIASITAADNSVVALARNGTLYAWGNGGSGQLGNGSTTNANSPTQVDQTGALAGKTIQSLAGMSAGYLALSTDGNVYTWGGNSSGALGNGSTTASAVPVAVSGFGGRQIASVAGLSRNGMALATDGTLFAWGVGLYGAIGNGGTADALSPTVVPTSGVLSGKTITQVVGAGSTVLALAADGTVAAWGDESSGTVGDGSQSYVQLVPSATTMPAVGFVVGGTSAAATRVTSTRYSFVAPAHAAGAVDVVVNVGGNANYPLSSTTLSGAYTYGAPTLPTSITAPTQGVPYSQSVAGGSAPGTTFTVSAGALPAGLTLNSATGLISGTPTALGAFSFTISATNGGATSVQVFTGSTTAATPTPGSSTTPTPTSTPAPSATPTPAATPVPSTTPAPTSTPVPSTTPTPSASPAAGSAPAPELSITIQVPVGAEVQGAEVQAKASGLRPGSAWTLTMHSTPVVLATGIVPSSGAIAKTIELPATIESGSHMLRFAATTASGRATTATTWFGVTAKKTLAGISAAGPVKVPATQQHGTDTDGTSLASTGFAVLPWLGGAVLLLILGVGLLRLSRRRAGTPTNR